jgi:hypothetical protein
VPSVEIYVGTSATGLSEMKDAESSDDEWYDLFGRRIGQPAKPGFYIREGKKILYSR